LLSSQQEPVQVAALKVIRNLLCQHPVNQKCFGEHIGIVKNLENLLSSQYEAVQVAALNVINNLTINHKQNQQRLGQCNGIITGLKQLSKIGEGVVKDSASLLLRRLESIKQQESNHTNDTASRSSSSENAMDALLHAVEVEQYKRTLFNQTNKRQRDSESSHFRHSKVPKKSRVNNGA
jgi:hypothetical protein